MSLFKKIINKLIYKKLSIATAESCTGGLLAYSFIKNKDSSKVFNGGFISYSNKLKISAHVCCHPRANIKKIKSFFPKISLSQGDTAKKIKNAKC